MQLQEWRFLPDDAEASDALACVHILFAHALNKT